MARVTTAVAKERVVAKVKAVTAVSTAEAPTTGPGSALMVKEVEVEAAATKAAVAAAVMVEVETDMPLIDASRRSHWCSNFAV